MKINKKLSIAIIISMVAVTAIGCGGNKDQSNTEKEKSGITQQKEQDVPENLDLKPEDEDKLITPSTQN
ncbi:MULTISPECIES: hypothetical protein [unclassified Clostridioides]|uniref:hypothetical protein n=1 Tax=unclassified Clostridioides TaxID=2635829 RepID=UPI001D0FA986|nr:hypothetical protein [Clostridioides sp. ES-S-0171-01]MCC0687281.1 hypothetical protein [Clostridioides sp. ES-S-0056-01]UDN56156.1 hypothetical protein JJC02_08380 [Clostridioides sp. ES-S-0054-01]